jgi:hypothetical protein
VYTEPTNVEGSGQKSDFTFENENNLSSYHTEFSGSGDAVLDLEDLLSRDSPLLLPNILADESLVGDEVTTEKEETPTTVDQVKFHKGFAKKIIDNRADPMKFWARYTNQKNI